MATQTDATTPEISVEMVGFAFVSQFYQTLHTSPELVHQFFNDSSIMSRPGPSGDLLTVTTIEGIKDVIHSLDCTNYSAEILTADTQPSHKSGVTVLVTGCLTGQDSIRRKFTESFFLAPQDNGYYVHNDAFRFIDEVSSPVADSVEESSEKHAPAVTAEPVIDVAPVQETVQVVEESHGNHMATPEEKLATPEEKLATPEEKLETVTEAVSGPIVQEKPTLLEKALPQPSVDSNLDVQPVVEASANGDRDAPKMSYASLLMNGKQGARTVPVHVAAKPVKSKLAPTSVPPPVKQTQAATVPAAASSESSAANRNAANNGNASSNGHVTGKGYSIYIGHLPYDANAELVEREFKQFGRIRKNGIQVRSNKDYVFGFIEYEDASAQQSAVKLGTIQIGGKEVFIEEKKTAARADDYSSGRGGYRNDGYRRGNFSNGRGYARNDYGNRRDGEGHPRGIRNGTNGDGYVYRNGGGRGAAPK